MLYEHRTAEIEGVPEPVTGGIGVQLDSARHMLVIRHARSQALYVQREMKQVDAGFDAVLSAVHFMPRPTIES